MSAVWKRSPATTTPSTSGGTRNRRTSGGGGRGGATGTVAEPRRDETVDRKVELVVGMSYTRYQSAPGFMEVTIVMTTV